MRRSVKPTELCGKEWITNFYNKRDVTDQLSGYWTLHTTPDNHDYSYYLACMFQDIYKDIALISASTGIEILEIRIYCSKGSRARIIGHEILRMFTNVLPPGTLLQYTCQTNKKDNISLVS